MSCPQNRQSAHNHPSPSRPFLRKQESHSVVSAQSPNPPTIPVPHKTIPAKAGISQCHIRTITKSAHNPPSPSRPFLRKQESHSVVSAQSPKSTDTFRSPRDHSCVGRNLTVSCPHNHQIRQQSSVPQVDHSCESRNGLWENGSVCAYFTDICTRHCEIPAFAGMVCGKTEVCVHILPLFAHDTVRFLPSQEWSRGGAGMSFISQNR